jgi:nitrite reductase/ring-hydroxylating ferredoxin subunit
MVKELLTRWPVVRQLLTFSDGTGVEAMSDRTCNLAPKNRGAGVARSVCPYCAVGCGQLVYHKDGKLVSIEGDPDSFISRFLAVPIVRYLLSPVIREKKIGYESWLSLGGLEQFPAGQTRLVTYRNPVVNTWDGETGDIACWVRNIDGQKFQVFAINCAHLGCPVRWFAQSNLFMCPCHGGAYYQDGSRASGPPERGLFQCHYKIEDGKLLIKAGEMPTPGQPVANKAGVKTTCA